MSQTIIPGIVNNQNICSLTEDTLVVDAAKKMAETNIAAIIVVDGADNLVGIVTERDMTRRVLAEGKGATDVKVGDIMTKSPDTLSPDDRPLDALELMRTRGYRHLPVASGGKCVGMVSIRDLYDFVHAELEKSVKETEAFVFGDRYGA